MDLCLPILSYYTITGKCLCVCMYACMFVCVGITQNNLDLPVYSCLILQHYNRQMSLCVCMYACMFVCEVTWKLGVSGFPGD